MVNREDKTSYTATVPPTSPHWAEPEKVYKHKVVLWCYSDQVPDPKSKSWHRRRRS